MRGITRSHALHATRLVIACVLAYYGSLLVGFREGYWALITAVVVTQPVFGETLAASRDRVIGTLIGAVAGLLVILGGQLGAPTLLLFWIAMLPLAMLTAIRPARRLCCITLAVVVLVPSTGPPFARPIDRVLEILLGTVASIAVSALVVPGKRDKTEPKHS